MSYQTRIDSTPVYEFPYSGPQANTIPLYNVDINLLLSNIAPPLGDPFYNQAPIITFQSSPQINPSVNNNAVIYQVPENVPIETILQQFGIDTRTLQPSNILDNYYRSVSQPVDVTVHTATNRRRRFVCRELSDSEDDNDQRHPAQNRRQNYNTWSNRSKQSPAAIHDLLSKVWNKAERASERLPPSSSAPNLNWQSMRNTPPPPPPPPPPPSNFGVNNAWQAMRNAPPPMSPDSRNAVNNVWNRADNATQQKANRLSNVFNRMRQPTGGIIHQTPPPQNREALNNFYAARNVPPGINQPPPPQNREALNNFYAARNIPPGLNQPPPPQNREALNNFYAARNIPPGINQPNPAISNVWNSAYQAPPSSPRNYAWNRMQQGAPIPPNSSFPYPPYGAPSRAPSNVPAPASFGALLAQAHRQQSAYAGAA